MVTIKTTQEIAIIKEGGQILAQILAELLAMAKPGVATIEIDRRAEKLIAERGGLPAFKNYQGDPKESPFPTTICASVNTQLVHTPASQYKLQSGDILTIDIGMKYPAEGVGYYTDMATTIAIGEVPDSIKKLLKVTEQSLNVGINQIKEGNHISDISKAIQKYVESNDFSVVRQLVGHGVSYQVHEDPRIPNFYNSRSKDTELKAGMVLAIEPMVNVGDPAVRSLDDGWTIVTADGKLCAHFEHTVAVTKDGYEILTQL